MLLLALVALCVSSAAARDTKMVIGINRHGARHSYQSIEKPQDIGALTQNGHRMAYLLGRFIRQKFPGFFPSRFRADDNFVYASALNRCRRTALAILMGIYDFGSFDTPFRVAPKFAEPEWEGLSVHPDFATTMPQGYQPVPVHSFLDVENFVFEPDRRDVCPKIYAKHSVEDPSVVKDVLAAINALLPKLRNSEFDYRKFVDKETFDRISDFNFADYIHSQRFMGHSLGLSDEDYRTLERVDTLVMIHFFFRFPEINKYLFTEMGRLLIKRLEELREDLKSSEAVNRFVLFSGHDVNVYAALLAAGLARTDCLTHDGPCTINPRYASVILMEVYADHGQHFVETTYNNEKVDFCVGKEGQDCTLDEFIQRLKQITLEGDIEALRDHYCRFASPPRGWKVAAMTVFAGLVAAIAGGLACLKLRRAPKPAY